MPFTTTAASCGWLAPINYPPPKKQERGYVAELTTLRLNREARGYLADELIGLGGESPKSSHDGAGAKIGRTDDELAMLLERSRINGSWHNAIRAATASMVGKGWSDLQIKLACAQYCNGQFDDRDLDKLIQDARKKWNRADPDDATQETPEPDKWPELDAAAYHGLAGDIVAMLEPHTEADPVGILLQVLATFGNIIGHSPHYQVESDEHHTNLFAVLVSTSAKGRKGTSGGRVRAITKDADEFWATERGPSGLSSGEGSSIPSVTRLRNGMPRSDAKKR